VSHLDKMKRPYLSIQLTTRRNLHFCFIKTQIRPGFFYHSPSRLCRSHRSNPSFLQTPPPHLPHPCARSPPSFRILPSYHSPTSDSIHHPSHAASMSLLLIALFKFGTENLFSSNIPEHHLAFAICRISGDLLACG
jgi:hypothetical protein